VNQRRKTDTKEIRSMLNSEAEHSIRKLRIALRFSLVDAVSPWLVLLFYLTDIDLIWVVNVNFVLLTLYLAVNYRVRTPSKFVNYLFFGAILLSLLKIISSIYFKQDLQLNHAFSYFYGLFMPMVALSFAKTVCSTDYEKIHDEICSYALKYFYIAVPTIFVYALLYFYGQVAYFGLGVNLHYIYPFFLTGKMLPVAVFMLLIVFSGKRSVLINYLAQTITFYGGSIKDKFFSSVLLFITLLVTIFALVTYTSLLDRFSWIFEGNFDWSDPYFLLVAAGGRFEEVFGIQNYFRAHPLDVFFGSAPGAYYIWAVDLSDYNATKNYSHVTVFGFIFRYGLVFAIPLYGFFIWRILKDLGSRNPFYIVFVGVFTSSLFGANLVIDPTSWIFIGLFLSLRDGKQRIKML
jgi:hypothetical protein